MLALPRVYLEALAALRRTYPGHRVVVIGATAVGHHVKLPRDTKDVDLALVAELVEIHDLLGQLGWTPDPRNPLRWVGPDDFRVDVLPASPALLAAGQLTLGPEQQTLSLLGLDLALDHSDAVSLAGTGETIEVAGLPSLVVLKAAAWMDQPYERRKDLQDLDTMLSAALPAHHDSRWDPTHPAGLVGLDWEEQSPFHLGRQVAEIMRPAHSLLLVDLLERLLDREEAPWLAAIRPTGGSDGDAEAAVRRRFEAFRHGLGSRSSG